MVDSSILVPAAYSAIGVRRVIVPGIASTLFASWSRVFPFSAGLSREPLGMALALRYPIFPNGADPGDPAGRCMAGGSPSRPRPPSLGSFGCVRDDPHARGGG